MPEWLIWTLIVAAIVALVLVIGRGQITTSTNGRPRFSDRYDPVYLQQQETLAAAKKTDSSRKE